MCAIHGVFHLASSKESSTKDIMTYDDYSERRMKLEKKQRKLLKRRFCSHELGPGRRLLDVYKGVLNKLEMPAEGVKAAKDQGILDIFQTDGDQEGPEAIPASDGHTVHQRAGGDAEFDVPLIQDVWGRPRRRW